MKTSRRDVLKLAGGATAVALVGPSVARASLTGNFDSPLDLNGGGTVVNATGPFSWDSDDAAGWVIATITQGNVVASGMASADPSKSTWAARLSTASGRLTPGTAQAQAVAVVRHNDGTLETYEWSQSVTLR